MYVIGAQLFICAAVHHGGLGTHCTNSVCLMSVHLAPVLNEVGYEDFRLYKIVSTGLFQIKYFD